MKYIFLAARSSRSNDIYDDIRIQMNETQYTFLTEGSSNTMLHTVQQAAPSSSSPFCVLSVDAIWINIDDTQSKFWDVVLSYVFM